MIIDNKYLLNTGKSLDFALKGVTKAGVFWIEFADTDTFVVDGDIGNQGILIIDLNYV